MNLYEIHESYRAEMTGSFRKLAEMLDRDEIDVTAFLAAQQRIFDVYRRKSLEMEVAK
jgi:hypothetical protein